jgi:hypothetical protein
MSTDNMSDAPLSPASPWAKRLKRFLIILSIPVVVGLFSAYMLWNTFFVYVEPNHMLLFISKSGDPLTGGQVLAKAGQKGVLEDVYGEGWHFVMPIVYTTQVKPNQVVPSGQVGIVTSLTGDAPEKGRVLAERHERGIWREVLMPGSYRLNPEGYKVEVVPMVKVEPGFIGIKRRLLVASDGDVEGIQEGVLAPGIYPINTKEFEVVSRDIGIYQTTFHAGSGKEKDGVISFPASDANIITLDCTVEWELKPEHWPRWLAKFGTREQIEQVVIKQHAQKICRDRGNNYKAQDFLDGVAREKFQDDFRQELAKACNEDKVIVRSAFIRNIIIPDNFLEQKRLERIAVETKLTSIEKTLTAETEKDVAKAKQTIDQAVQKVQEETDRLVGSINQTTQTLQDVTKAEIDQMRDEYAAKIATIDAMRKEVLGKADAEAKKLKETAESSIFKMKMDVFNRDNDAYLRYTMSQKLNDNLKLRLFQAGPGTLWTNMGDKSMNLFMPMPTEKAKPEKEPSKPEQKD